MLCSTYESASTRRFTYGRVDSIRASHPEALAWAKSMLDKSKTKDEKKELFKEAISKQTKIMKENIFGEGENNVNFVNANQIDNLIIRQILIKKPYVSRHVFIPWADS